MTNAQKEGRRRKAEEKSRTQMARMTQISRIRPKCNRRGAETRRIQFEPQMGRGSCGWGGGRVVDGQFEATGG